MEHPFQLIMFDLDGTLVDSQSSIVASMSAAFRDAGLPAPAPEAVRRIVGLRLEVAIARLAPEADPPLVDRLAAGYRQRFVALRGRPDYEETLFPGAREALEALNQPEVCLGIATGKNRRGLNLVLEHHGLSEHFVVLKTADDGPGKPHPGILESAMSEIGVAARKTVMVGDTTYDVEMACNAGVRAVGVSWGYHEPEELTAAGASRVIARFADLAPTLAALPEQGS